MVILVTGGAGYIGSHTVALLRERGHDVVVIDDLSTGNRAAVGQVPLVVGDIADRDLVSEVLRDYGVAAVLHFAGSKAARASLQQPASYFTNNLAGSLALFDAAVSAGVTSVVFSSSCSVYGNPDSVPVDEDARLAPISPYGESKAMVERVLTWLGRSHGLRSVSLRYFNAAGAAGDGSLGEDWSHSPNLIPLAAKAALGRGPALRILGGSLPTADGTAVRDYLHVEDLAEAHVQALDHLLDGGGSEVLNLGTGVGSSVLEVVRALEAVSGVTVPFEVVDPHPGDPEALFANPTQAANVLGWRARRDLVEMVASAWRWHSARPYGYET